MKYFPFENENIPEQSVVLMGIPSKGNIGQLAIDCIISTLLSMKKLHKLGYLESEFLIPMTGYESMIEHTSNNMLNLCMPLEVYGVSRTNYIILQQRSPCIRGCSLKYAQELINYLKSLSYLNLIVFAGSGKEGIEITNKSLKLFSCSMIEKQFSFLQIIESFIKENTFQLPISRLINVTNNDNSHADENHDESRVSFQPPSGCTIARALLLISYLENQDYLLIGSFYENINRIEMSKYLAAVVLYGLGASETINTEPLKTPLSWQSLTQP